MTAMPTLVPAPDSALLEAVIEQAPTPLWVIAPQGTCSWSTGPR